MDRRRFLGAIASGGVLGVAGCGAPSGDPEETPTEVERVETATPETETATETGTPESETATAEDESLAVDMVTEGQAYYFDPIGLSVDVGETVTFVNGSGSHSSTAYHEGNDVADVTRIPDGAESWDSGTLTDPDATFEHTFETPGTYDYFCVPHKSLEMVGRIVVGDPGGPAEGSLPPDGDVPESDAIVDEGSIAYEDFDG